MKDTNSSAADTIEHCRICADQTPHEVSLEIRTESNKSDNAEFSREPYRITHCLICGEITSQRMNNG
ncbi:hypothetical protein DMJ13_20540 [halophilic archaeon]|nr:hypothetical protein DMJ13_20540 [halophilic archaeon]